MALDYPFTFRQPIPITDSFSHHHTPHRVVRALPAPPEQRRPSEPLAQIQSSLSTKPACSKRGWFSTAEQSELEEEDPQPKRRRGLAGTIVDTSITVALVGTAVGLTAYRLWRDRGKVVPPQPDTCQDVPSTTSSDVIRSELKDEIVAAHDAGSPPPPAYTSETSHYPSIRSGTKPSSRYRHGPSASLGSPSDFASAMIVYEDVQVEDEDPHFLALSAKLSTMLAEAQSALMEPFPSFSSRPVSSRPPRSPNHTTSSRTTQDSSLVVEEYEEGTLVDGRSVGRWKALSGSASIRNNEAKAANDDIQTSPSCPSYPLSSGRHTQAHPPPFFHRTHRTRYSTSSLPSVPIRSETTRQSIDSRRISSPSSPRSRFEAHTDAERVDNRLGEMLEHTAKSYGVGLV